MFVLELATSTKVGEFVSHPWAGAVIQLLLRAKLLLVEAREIPRSPTTWVEWLWSWFGYEYYDVVYDLQADVLRIIMSFTLLLLGYVILAALLGGIVSLFKWLLGEMRSSLARALAAASNGITRVFRWLASLLAPDKPKVKLDRNSPSSMVHESIVPGSSFTNGVFPRSQVRIGYKDPDGETFTATACGVIMYVGDSPFCVTAAHAVAAYSETSFSLLGSAGDVLIHGDQAQPANAIQRVWFVLDTDLVAFKLDAKEVSTLGVRKAGVVPVLTSSGRPVTITGADGSSTTALLKDSSCFGYVQYFGSTTGGFSGAGYYLGSSLAGIHTSGGQANLGYSAQYVYVTLSYFAKFEPEDTTDWLKKNFQEGLTVEVDETWDDNETYRIKVKGKYHIVPYEAYETYEAQYAKKRKAQRSYENSFIELESKNLTPAQGGSQPSTGPGLRQLISECVSSTLRQELSKPQSVKGGTGKKSGKEPKQISAGPSTERAEN